MRISPKVLVVTAAELIAAALVAFYFINLKYGPGDMDEPGVVVTYICSEPGCSTVVRFEYEAFRGAGAEDPGDVRECPECGRVSLRRAERCSSCGELIPTPQPDRLLEAKCPECGKDIFGPLGGGPVDKPVPRKSPEEDEQW